MPRARLTNSRRIEALAASLAASGPREFTKYQSQKAAALQGIVERSVIDPTTIFSSAQLLRDQVDEIQEVKDRLDRGQYGALENGFYWEEVARIWRGFCRMEEQGNKGWPALELPGPVGRFVAVEDRYRSITMHCLWFKPGIGWRLNERGWGWAAMMKNMFPRALERFALPMKKGETA